MLKRPRPIDSEIVEYQQSKTAAGGSGAGGGGSGTIGGGGGSGFKAGQNLVCGIVAAEPGGYTVVLKKGNLSGFLPTEVHLKRNEEVLAQFVCMHNGRVLLASRLRYWYENDLLKMD